MTQLFAMGGYEVYVWSSVGLGLAVYAWNVFAPGRQRREVWTRLAEPDDETNDRSNDGSNGGAS